MDKTKIAILCPWDFPIGLAPTTRIIAYAKALEKNDCKIEIFSFVIKKKESTDCSVVGKIDDNISYKIPHLFNPHGKRFKILGIIDYIILLNKVIYNIYRSNKKKKFHALLISFDYIHALFFFIPILRILNIPLFFVADEFPPEIRKMEEKVSWYNTISYKIIHQVFRGRILMTAALKDYYDNLLYKPTFLMSTIVDENRFDYANEKRHSNSEEYLCYMGNCDLTKDNVDNIILAFNEVKKRYPSLQFYIFGDPSPADSLKLNEIIITNSLESRVILKGRAPYSKVPELLCHAKLLVSSQPKTVRAKGGFPTKLGEYLLSGVPTILTDAGEISVYITNDIHAKIVPQNDYHAFANAIIGVLDNYKLAQQMAENGKQYILKHFSSKVIGADLKQFLLSLS